MKAEFNPEKNDMVDQIKNKSAELIDLLETIRNPSDSNSSCTSECHRLVSLAQTSVENAAMWGVKANYTE